MKSFNIEQASILLLGLFLAGCSRAPAGPPLLAQSPHAPVQPAMDFPALVGDNGCIVQVDSSGKTSVEEIDFLKGKTITHWDMATLDEVVTVDIGHAYAGKYPNPTVINYYKDRKFVRSFPLKDIYSLVSMMIVPQKNCLLVILSRQSSPGTTPVTKLVSMDLTDGSIKKEVPLARSGDTTSSDLNLGAFFRDGRGEDLFVVIRKSAQGPIYNPVVKHDLLINYPIFSITRMNPDDLSTQVLAEARYRTPGDVEIDGLLSYDRSANQAICYGTLGGPISSNRRSAFFSVSLATGQVTEIMSISGYEGIGQFSASSGNTVAMINNQYVIMIGWGTFVKSWDPYCVDLKSKTWRELTSFGPAGGFISHDGLLIDPAATAPAEIPPATVTTTPPP